MPGTLTPQASAWLSNQATAFPGGSGNSSYIRLVSAIQSSTSIINDLNTAVATMDSTGSQVLKGIVFDHREIERVANYRIGTDQNIYISSGLLNITKTPNIETIQYVIGHEIRHSINKVTSDNQNASTWSILSSQISSNTSDYTSALLNRSDYNFIDEGSADVSGANAVIGAIFDTTGSPVSSANALSALISSGYSDHFFNGTILKPGIYFDANGFLIDNSTAHAAIGSGYNLLQASGTKQLYPSYYRSNELAAICQYDPDHSFSINFAALGFDKAPGVSVGTVQPTSPEKALMSMIDDGKFTLASGSFCTITDTSTSTTMVISAKLGGGFSIKVDLSTKFPGLTPASGETALSFGSSGMEIVKTGGINTWVVVRDYSGMATGSSVFDANGNLLLSQSISSDGITISDPGNPLYINNPIKIDTVLGPYFENSDGTRTYISVTPPSISAPSAPSAPPSRPAEYAIDYIGFSSSFGSTLGRLLGGSDLVLGVGLGTVISASALTVGQRLFGVNAFYKSDGTIVGRTEIGGDSVWNDFGNSLTAIGTNAAIGSASSYLAAEFAQAIGLDGFAGELFSSVTGNVLQHTATQLVQGANVGSLFTDTGFGKFGASLKMGLASFFGSQLGSLIISPQTVAEATFASLGSAAVSIFAGEAIGTAVFAKFGLVAGSWAGPVGAAIGAFVGFVVGALFGSLFGKPKPRIPTSSAEVILQIPQAQYALGVQSSANGGNLQLSDSMARIARDTLNGIIAQVTGGQTPSFVSNSASPTQIYGHDGAQLYVKLAGTQYDFASADRAVDKGVLWALPQTKIIGGDIFLKRAIANGSWSTVTPLLGDLQIAREYKKYMKGKPLIDGAISDSWNNLSAADRTFYSANKAFMTRAISASQLPLTGADIAFYNANQAQIDGIVSSISVSAFAAGWIVTLTRAAELGLDKFGPSDFYGGLQGFLQSFGINSTGTQAHYEDVSLNQNMNNLAISVAGEGAPGTFSVLPTAINGPTDQDIFNPRFQRGVTGWVDGSWSAGNTNNEESIPGWTLWTSSSAASWTNNPDYNWSSGKDVLYVHLDGTQAVGMQAKIVSDPITSAAGVAYSASVYAAQHRGTAEMRMLFYDASGNWLQSAIANGTARENGGWEGDLANFNQLTVTATAPAGTAFRRIALVDISTGGLNTNALFTRPESHEASLGLYDGSWDAGGQGVQIEDFAAVSGYNIASPSTKTAGNDLIIAPDNGVAIGVWDYLGGDDMIIGGRGNDNLNVGQGGNWIDGRQGDDTIHGGSGRDVLLGGLGNDNVVAGSGLTYLAGGAGTDSLTGGSADDVLVGGDGADTINGGGGDDVVIIDQDGGATLDIINGGAGSDTVSFERFDAAVTIDMSVLTPIEGVTVQGAFALLPGQSIFSPNGQYQLAYQTDSNLVLYGPSGVTWHSVTYGQSVGQTYFQSDGNLVVYDASWALLWNSGTWGNPGARLELDNIGRLRVVSANNATLWQSGNATTPQLVNNVYGDQWTSIENLAGSNFDDVLTAAHSGSVLKGLIGNDTLNGGIGNDVLEGGGGVDQINGGGGTNTASYAASQVGVYVSLETGTTIGGDATGDVLTSIQNLTGSRASDLLAGDSAANVLDGGEGNDVLEATTGADAYKGGEDYDILDYSLGGFVAGGSQSAVFVSMSGHYSTVRSSSGALSTNTLSSIEHFVGSNSNDIFYGNGTDIGVTWNGGGGNDIVVGGTGSDTYVYDQNYGNLTVTDTNAASNTIRIEEGLTFNDLIVNNNAGTLRVGLRGQAGEVSVANNFATADNAVIKTIDMAGASQIDLTQMAVTANLSDSNNVYNGSASVAPMILGNNGDDTINAFGSLYSTKGAIIGGGLGNDIIRTSVGDDQYLFERGDGHDIIYDSGGKNIILFGPTVGANDPIFEIVGTDLYVGITDLNAPNLTASNVADNIKIIGGGVKNQIYHEYYDPLEYPPVAYYYPTEEYTFPKEFSIQAGGATVDLTKANIDWVIQPKYINPWVPIILDLGGDGLEITPVAQSDIVTVDAAGNVLRTAWVGPTNGILAYDRDGDGKINNTFDLSFRQDKEGATTDLEGLAGWDSNGDGVLNAKDANFDKLRVWVDANQDGRAKNKEVQTLAEAGVVAINLKPVPTGFDGSDTTGSVVHNTLTFDRADGSTGTGYDVALGRQLLAGSGAMLASGEFDPRAKGTLGQLKNDPLAIAKGNGARDKDLKNKDLSQLADVDISDAGGTISDAAAQRWAHYIDPVKNQARKDLITAGGEDARNIDAIKSTRARPKGDGQLTGRGVDSAQTRLQAVVIDLGDDGVDLIVPEESKALVDVAKSGELSRIGWVDKSDAILAYDRNGDGVVDPASDISFLTDVANARTSLQGLEGFDDNHDGVLSGADNSFANFLIWRDANANGLSDLGELQSLAAAGVKDIQLKTSKQQPDQGQTDTNDVLGTGTITFTDGSTSDMYNVALGFADSEEETAPQSSAPGQVKKASAQISAVSTASASSPVSSAAPAGATTGVSQGSSAQGSVGRARGAVDGPNGLIVGASGPEATSNEWWRDPATGAQTLTNLAASLLSEGSNFGVDAAVSATGQAVDAAMLQRQMLLRQNMAGFSGDEGSGAAIWARTAKNDSLATLAANGQSPLISGQTLPVAG